QAVTVRINKPPVITGTFLAVGVTTKPIPENSTQDIGTVTAKDPDGADKGKFEISSAGALTFKSQPSRTTAGDANGDFVYNVTVRASDGTKHRQQAVTVRINKPPVITGTFLAVGVTTKPIPENSTQDIGTVTAKDPDGDNNAITWALTGTDGAQMRVSGVYPFGADYAASITFVEVPEYELASDSPYWDSDKDHVYVFNVQAFDAYGPTTSVDLRVKVTNEDEPPKLSGFATVTVDEGLTAVGTYTAVDPEGESILWALAGDDRGDFNISSSGALTFKTAPSHSSPADQDMDNVYKVTIRAKDATGTEAKTADLSVEVTVQSASIFRFTGGRATYAYSENGTAAVATYTAADPSSQTISYSLEGTDAGDFSIDSSSGEVTFASTPNYESPTDDDADNEYEFTVKATAGSDSITKAVTVTVANVDEPITVTGPATVSKPGGGAKKVAEYTGSDPEGQVFWSVTGTDATAFVIEPKSEPFVGELKFKATPDFDNPADADGDNVYEVTVVARDQLAFARNTDSINVTVTVTADQTANVSPVITGGGASHNFAENGTAAVSTYTATDADGDTITWSLEGTDAADFSISTSGVLTFASAPDFETPADSGTDNIYNVTVKASDGTDSDTIAVTVTVTAVDEPPAFTAGAISTTYAENGTTAVSTYTATDPEGTAVTFSLEGTDSAAFSISTSGALTFDSAPDYETKASYAVTVKATAGSKSATRNVTITISNVNEAPSITGGGPTHSHAENDTSTISTYSATDPDAGTTITWSVEGTDSGSFSINTDGELSFSAAPDFETKSSYAVTVKASDGSLSATLAVTVTVTNVDEPPTLSGTKVHTKTEGADKSLSTYTATDPEGATVTWSLTGTDAGDFEISTGGVLTFKNAPDFDNPTDADTNNIYLFNVKAADGTGSTAKSSTLSVKVTVNGVNEAPTITAGGATHNYAENGTAAVATYTATDPEGTTISWTLEGDDAADFDISTGGVLTFDSTPDREDPDDDNTDNVYEITVKASDGTLSDTLDVEITVTNVDEVPTLSGATSVTKVEDVGKVVTTYTAADPEGQTIVWSLSGTDAADFTIPSGVLTFKVVPDADNPHDADTDNVYEVTVKAADGTASTALSKTLDVEVTVSETNDTPTITGGGASHSYAEEGEAAIATYTATDDEGDTIVWTVSGADASKFAITTGGVLSFEDPPDFETPGDTGTDNVYNVTVEASDGNTAGTLAVTVTVTAVDEPPEIGGSAAITKVEEDGTSVTTYTATDPEGATTITWSLTGTDAADFSLSTAGVLTFKQVPDFDDPDDADGDNRYEITINAADGTDATAKTGTLDVVVTVSDTNESPVIVGSASYVYDEDRTDAVATFTATDPEGDTVGWSLSGDDASAFDITEGVLTFSTQPDYENHADSDTDGDYEITVEASDGTNTPTLDVTVTVDNVNEAPTITTDSTSSKLEYTAGLTVAVHTFAATDPDADTTLRWTVEGTDRGDFDISSDGVLTFKKSPDFDAPADANRDNVYDIT
ncbi:MAG: cadherin domain-containing protein, partial [Gemmatimonadetes bacterium]|nr:cadherin domain-containing protein [Gemmatimonadota bacterium]